MEQQDKKRGGLPENANRELKDGEKYVPILPPEQNVPEVSFYSVSVGVLMAVLFSAAAAYLGLKVGQVFEAAIPIAIIAVGLSSVSGRKNALGENVIIQSIGSASGVIVAGAIFTLPALYILQAKYPDITVSFMQVFLSSLLGGILGILFLIPFRKYFVSDMHGKYPFPEATATTQVLVSGEKRRRSSQIAYFCCGSGRCVRFYCFHVWHMERNIEFAHDSAWRNDSSKIETDIFDKYECSGFRTWLYCRSKIQHDNLCRFVICLVVHHSAVGYDHSRFGDVEWHGAGSNFTNYARYIGIGGIAMAGIIGIVKSWGVIKSAVGLAGKEFGGKAKAVAQAVPRTQRDLSMRFIVIATVLALIATLLFFYFGVIHNFMQAFIAFVVVTLIAFLFTTVAANAIAIVGTNPVSGMTLMTLIIASVILVATGLKGTSGMVAAMVIGGVVCTALSMAGGFITDLKIGYWIGTTPAKQETWKFLGTLVSAATVGGVIIILEKTYGFTGENALVAPQANAMAAVIEPLMMGAGRTLVALRCRCYFGIVNQCVGCSCIGICIRYVHSITTEYAFGNRRFDKLVCDVAFQR